MDLINNNPAPTNSTLKIRGRLVLTKWTDNSISAEVRFRENNTANYVRIAVDQRLVNTVVESNPTAYPRGERDSERIAGRLMTPVGTVTLDTSIIGSATMTKFVVETTPTGVLDAFDKAFSAGVEAASPTVS
ncbi:MAG: hypothetical protein HUJ63_06965 [Enterococcus sp.]|nr:hypothetical protein [Enterococcus sp.]